MEYNISNIPLYELYFSGIQNPTFLDVLAYHMHRLNWHGIFDRLIFMLDEKRFKDCDKRSKLIRGVSVDIPVLTGDGTISNAYALYMTRPFDVWTLTLEDGVKMSGADEHIIYADVDREQDWFFIDEVHEGDFVYTAHGWKQITDIRHNKSRQYMCDMSLDDVKFV